MLELRICVFCYVHFGAFIFQVSVKTYHIQAILKITSPFQVESTPVTCCPSPLLLIWFRLIRFRFSC